MSRGKPRRHVNREHVAPLYADWGTRGPLYAGTRTRGPPSAGTRTRGPLYAGTRARGPKVPLAFDRVLTLLGFYLCASLRVHLYGLSYLFRITVPPRHCSCLVQPNEKKK